MWSVVLIVIVALIALSLAESIVGKIVVGAAVVAIGLLLLRWITGLTIFVTLAKVCAIVMVVAIVGAILIRVI